MTAQKAEVDCEAWYPPHPLQPLTLKPCAGKITISVFGPKGGRFPLVWLVWMILTRALRDRTVGVAVRSATADAEAVRRKNHDQRVWAKRREIPARLVGVDDIDEGLAR